MLEVFFLMTASMVAGAPRTDDLLIRVAPQRVQSTYDSGTCVAVLLSCRHVQMGDLCPATPKKRVQGGREGESPRILSMRSGARNRNRDSSEHLQELLPSCRGLGHTNGDLQASRGPFSP